MEGTGLDNPRTSAFGIFHADLRDVSPDCIASNPQGCTAVSFVEDVFTFEEKAKLLLPRAVGYGRAFADHAFNGIIYDGAPAMHLTAQDIETGMGTLKIENATPHDWIAGTISVWFDDRTTGLRRQLGGSVGPMTIIAGGSVTLGPTDLPLDQLATQGPITGQIAVLFEGAMGDLAGEADPYGLAARVCECPVDEATTDPLATDCLGLCPCTWRETTMGRPGTPGDGVTVPPAFVSSSSGESDYPFTSCQPANVPEAPPFTLTLFPASELRAERLLATVGFSAPCGDQCGAAHPGSARGAAEVGTTTFAGRTGYHGTIQSLWNGSVSCGGEQYPPLWAGARSCFTADPAGCAAAGGCACVGTDLDALLFCHGADAFPSDP